MAKIKTWVWVIVGLVAAGILCIVALAAAGLWFVRSHVDVRQTTSAAAATDFERERARFSAQRPLIELDETGDFLRANIDRPEGAVRPRTFNVLVFDPDNEKVVRVELPFWLLRLRSGAGHFTANGAGVDLEKLHLTVEDLERYGPTLILDHRDHKGTRVLVWSQ